MAAPTPEQITALEKEHKEQFAQLVAANNLYLNTGKDISKMTPTQKDAFLKFDAKIRRLAQIWQARQSYLEKNMGIPKYYAHFFNPNYQQALNDELKRMDRSGIGFIPLLIWAGIALVGAISASYIVSQITDTAQEKQELITATGDYCAKLGLTKEQCVQLMSQGIESTSGGLEGIIKPVLWAGFAFLVITNLDKITNAFQKR